MEEEEAEATEEEEAMEAEEAKEGTPAYAQSIAAKLGAQGMDHHRPAQKERAGCGLHWSYWTSDRIPFTLWKAATRTSITHQLTWRLRSSTYSPLIATSGTTFSFTWSTLSLVTPGSRLETQSAQTVQPPQ
jgi:hypothetical protein